MLHAIVVLLYSMPDQNSSSPSKTTFGKLSGLAQVDVESVMSKDPVAVNVVKSMILSHRTPRDFKFFLIVTGVFVCFAGHNFMQEYIMSMPGFNVGIFLGYLEVVGVTGFSLIERVYAGDLKMKARWTDYGTVTAILLMSSGFSNTALGYINYPTKVVFRSCKLIPTMAVAVFFNHRRVEAFQFFYGALLSVGMILFAAADFHTVPTFNGYGITLVSLSVVADAFLPNVQERIFEKGASRAEVSFSTNLLCLGAMTVWMLFTQQLQAALIFSFASQWNLFVMMGYTVLSYVAISFHMTMVKEFGGVTAVLVGNTRKVLSVILSFFFFPKPFSWLYVGGGVLVFGSIIASEMTKELQKRESKRRAAEAEEEKEVLVTTVSGSGIGGSNRSDGNSSDVRNGVGNNIDHDVGVPEERKRLISE